MPLAIACPKCKAQYNVPESQAGKSVRCKPCQTIIPIPSAVSEPQVDDLLMPELQAAPEPQAPKRPRVPDSALTPAQLAKRQRFAEANQIIEDKNSSLRPLVRMFASAEEAYAYYGDQQAKHYAPQKAGTACSTCTADSARLRVASWYKQIGDRISASPWNVVSPINKYTVQSVPIIQFDTHHRLCGKCVTKLRLRLTGLPILLTLCVLLGIVALFLMSGMTAPELKNAVWFAKLQSAGLPMLIACIVLGIVAYRWHYPAFLSTIRRGVFSCTKIRTVQEL